MSVAPATTASAVRASVLTAEPPGAAYEPFDVVDVDAAGARLAGPLLLEVGEVVTLRLTRGPAQVQVQARVTAVARGGAEPVSSVVFVDAREGALAPLLAR